jgi:hypothetical protein
MIRVSWKKLFARPARESTTRRRPKRRVEVEPLETRQLLSWNSVPSTLGWPSSVNVNFNSNANSGTAINRNEVDVYAFVAPRSGTYTFKAGQYGSQIDTIEGLYTWSGHLIAGNNNSGGAAASSFTAYVTGGTRYAFAITNHTGTSNGGYQWSITGPSIFVAAANNAGNGITSYGSASLNGNTLTVYLAGLNRSNFYYYDHRADVYLLDGNNQPIHTGSWSVTFRTGGTFVPGLPSSKTQTATFDVSGFDLRNLRTMQIDVT